MSSRFGAEEERYLAKRPQERPGAEGGKRLKNRRERVDALCEAGVALFLERGIEGVTVEEITQQAGVAKGSFYRYFQDKVELLEVIFRPVSRGVQELMEAKESRLRETEHEEELFEVYQAMAEGLTTLFLPYLDVVLLYLQEHRAPAVPVRKPLSDLAQMIEKNALILTEAAHQHGLLRPFSPHLSAFVVVGAVEHLLYAFLKGTLSGDPEEVSINFISLILDGIRIREDQNKRQE